jgi:hypothetical protein
LPGVADAFHWTDPDAHWVLDHDTHCPAAWDHPITHIEPKEGADEIRAAYVRCIVLINQFGSIMQEALEGKRASVDHALTRLYACGFALGCNFVGGTTLTQKAQQLGVSKALLSRHATAFLAAAGLEPSFYLKCTEARKTYAQRRREVVLAQNGNGNGSEKSNSPVRITCE